MTETKTELKTCKGLMVSLHEDNTLTFKDNKVYNNFTPEDLMLFFTRFRNYIMPFNTEPIFEGQQSYERTTMKCPHND